MMFYNEQQMFTARLVASNSLLKKLEKFIFYSALEEPF